MSKFDSKFLTEEDLEEEPDSGGYRIFNEGDGSDTQFAVEFDGHVLELEQVPSDQTIGHGAVVWEAAVIFSKYMQLNNSKVLSHSSLVGKTVLELGSGPGLAGCAMMLRGAKVTLTDLGVVTRELTERNARSIYKRIVSKGSGATLMPLSAPLVHPLDWTDKDNVKDLVKNARSVLYEEECEIKKAALQQIEIGEDVEHAVIEKEKEGEGEGEGIAESQSGIVLPYDYVLLTDCVFSAALVPDLIRTILESSGQRSTVICVHEIRDAEANAEFLARLGDHFKVKHVPQSQQDPLFRHEIVQIVIAKPIRGGAGKGKKEKEK